MELSGDRTWKLDLTNATHRWVAYGAYQGPGFWNWARKNLPANSVVADSGANIGQTVISFASLPQVCQILAFEPGAAAYRWLSNCVRLNELNHVRTIEAALSDSPGFGVVTQEGPVNTHGAWDKVLNEGSGHKIRVTTMDEFVAEQQLEGIELWKLDMEGGEFRALQGAAKTLAAGRIEHLLIEISGNAGREIPSYLSRFGYQAFELTDWGRARPLTSVRDYQDVLFSRSP